MSTNLGFYLQMLRLTGKDVDAAEVTFGNGLNVIWGASNTGKSFIFACIDFMLGRESQLPQIAVSKGYTTGWLTIVARATQKQWLLERDLQGGDIRVYSMLDDKLDESSGLLLRSKADPDRQDTIHHFILSTFGMEGKKIMRPKTKGGSRNVSWRDMAHFTFIEEERIIAKTTPVHPTMQRTDVTPELSMLSLMISGQDFNSLISIPDIKVEKASWYAKNELYKQLISELQTELGNSSPSQDEIVAQIARCDSKIADVTTKIDESNQVISDLMGRRQFAWEEAHKAKSRLAVIGQLKDRFEQLSSHYKSDMQRLQLISEGDYFLAQLGDPHCPYCGGPLSAHSAEQLQKEASKGSIQDASATEAQKIAANIHDLEKTLATLEDQAGQLGTQVTLRQREIKTTEAIIRQQLEPRVGIDKKELAELVAVRSKLILTLDALERLAMFTNRLQLLGAEPKKSRSGTSAVTGNPDTRSLRQFADEIAIILKDWRYLKTGVVEFDAGMDLVVAGDGRGNQGKGIRAVLHAAFTVGLMTHCRKRELMHSGLVMLDSPLTSYKEKDKYEVEEDIQVGFFESLLKLPEDQQVIVFENKEPPASVLPRLRHTHFSGTPGINRAGFIPV